MRHTIAKLRPEGTRCCVPDYLEAKHDTFRLCAWKECGSEGRRSAVGVCRKPQRPSDPRTCLDVLREFLSEEEQRQYEKAVRTETTDEFARTQLRLSKTLYRTMRRRFLDGQLTQIERENRVFDSVFQQVQMAGYVKSYTEAVKTWLNKNENL